MYANASVRLEKLGATVSVPKRASLSTFNVAAAPDKSPCAA